MMAYSIEAAIKSGIFDEVMVSTDSEEYAEIGRRYGASVPFLRSEQLSSDKASSWDVVREVLTKYAELGKTFDMFTLLQPTSPLRTEQDIRNAYHIFTEKNASAVVSICEMEHSPLWCNTLPADGSLKDFISRDNNVQRQRLDKYYRLNGALYMVGCEAFAKDWNVYGEGSFAYVMSSRSSIDIDDETDMQIAEMLLKNWNE